MAGDASIYGFSLFGVLVLHEYKQEKNPRLPYKYA